MDPLAVAKLIPSKYNALLPPNWRWERASLLRTGTAVRVRKEDKWVKLIRQFQIRIMKAKTPAEHERIEIKYPGLYNAWLIWINSQPDTKFTIEAYLCSGASISDIAQRCRVALETIVCYSHMFYDVVDRLENSAYMVNVAFRKSIHSGLAERDYDLLWKLIGYLGGCKSLDVWLRFDERSNIATEREAKAKIESLFRSVTNAKALTAMMTIPVAYNQEVIFSTYAKLKDIEQKTEGPNSYDAIANSLNALVEGIGFNLGKPKPGKEKQVFEKFDRAGIELRASEQLDLVMNKKKPESVIVVPFPESERKKKDA